LTALWSRLWRHGPEPGAAARWLVLDVESSGLDPSRDRLLAVAAVAVHLGEGPPRIVLADSFAALLAQPANDAAPDKGNILVHGIGVAAQGHGADPATVLQRFEDFVAGAPLIGFHVAFDRTLIDRAMQAVLGRRLAATWLDLADLAPVLHPVPGAKALDDWLQACDIPCLQRHQAAADTLATAELLLRLLPAARAEGATDIRGLVRLAARRRWLP
jgi:DNA polymerase III subunit epsilon